MPPGHFDSGTPHDLQVLHPNAPWCAASFRRCNRDVRLRDGRSTCVLPNIEREDDMAESVYKVIELIGTSKDSWEKAAAAAVTRAGKSLRNLRVAEVVQLDLQLDAKGKVEAYRAKLKVSFKFDG
jgi:flavin-binding protein dodecin